MAKNTMKMKLPSLSKEEYSQLLERLNMVFVLVNDQIIQHPVCKLDKKISKGVEEALFQLHQAIIETEKKRELL